ncbi:MAG: pilus assembly protein PilP [Pseudomonadota bacterium]|nr:pilus assembly protein PilP [Pseudomonadota bacterium]
MSDTPEATARKATEQNALDMNALALLGTITAPGGRAALIRTPRGDIHRVTTGDRVAGAQVTAITDGRIHLVKNGIARVYEMPRS